MPPISESSQDLSQATEKVIFYGVSRFDCPGPGYTFRHRDGRVLSLETVDKEFLGHRADDLSRPSWRFIADCRIVTAAELRRLGS